MSGLSSSKPGLSAGSVRVVVCVDLKTLRKAGPGVVEDGGREVKSEKSVEANGWGVVGAKRKNHVPDSGCIQGSETHA